MGAIYLREYPQGHPRNEDTAFDAERQRKDDEARAQQCSYFPGRPCTVSCAGRGWCLEAA